MLVTIARWFSSRLQSEAIESATRQIVVASLDRACERIDGEAQQMSLSETRGYIRARSADVVRLCTRNVLAGKSFDTVQQQQVRRAATERLIPQVMRRLERLQVQRVLHRAAA